MNVCFFDRRSKKSVDLPQIFTNMSDEPLFQHIQMPGLLLGEPRQLPATDSWLCAPQWSTWAKRRKPKSWSKRHQSPMRRAFPTRERLESSCANRVCRARSMLIAHIEFWKCLTRVLSPEQIISSKDGELREAKGVQEACDTSVNWSRFGPGTLHLELLKMLLSQLDTQDCSGPCSRN